MSASDIAVKRVVGINEEARQRILSRNGEPLFLADWDRAVFVHYEVDSAILQREVPFKLDLREGKAYISLVAFTMRRMRPYLGGFLAEWILKPIATHEFLNVRTYVVHKSEPGIYFLAEWLSNSFSVHLGPKTFGLPYRFGKISYQHRYERGELNGTVQDGDSFLKYSANLDREISFEPCANHSLQEFLMERYTAFTKLDSTSRLFRIWHPPWPQVAVQIDMIHADLLTKHWPWFNQARLIGANFSPGVRDVWMGRPHRIDSH